MLASFKRPFLSINSFASINIPEFVVITGKNGSGKTHFLKAIHEEAIHFPGIFKSDIRLFNNVNFTTRAISQSTPIDSKSVESLHTMIRNSIRANHAKIEAILKSKDLPYSNEFIRDFLRQTKHEVHNNYGELGLASYKEIKEIAYKMAALATPATRPLVSNLTLGSGRIFDENINVFRATLRLGQVDIFQENIQSVFEEYRNARLEQILEAVKASTNNETIGEIKLTIDRRFGVPPWTTLNEIFKEYELDIRISEPDIHSYSEYKPIFTKNSSGAQISPNDFSSGEKVLFSLICAVFYQRNGVHLVKKPKLLLLDEVDAALHPSIAKQLIEFLSEEITKKQGISVILTTHSPSTIAAAPEDSVYEMRVDPQSLKK